MNKNIPNSIASSIRCTRTFKCWLIELRQKAKGLPVNMDLEQAKMYYNGGYSPKMVINEELRIPIGWDVL